MHGILQIDPPPCVLSTCKNWCNPSKCAHLVDCCQAENSIALCPLFFSSFSHSHLTQTSTGRHGKIPNKHKSIHKQHANKKQSMPPPVPVLTKRIFHAWDRVWISRPMFCATHKITGTLSWFIANKWMSNLFSGCKYYVETTSSIL